MLCVLPTFFRQHLTFHNVTATMSLQTLPPELIERVVVPLPLSDIGSLRLTNSCLASNAAQKHLKARFQTKRVEITEERLRSFVAVTASDGLGCLLRDLTLVAPVYNTSELTARLEENAAQLAELDEDGQFVDLDFRDLTDEETRQAKLDLVVLQERLSNQLDLLRHQNDVTLLGQALSNLAKRGGSLRVLRTDVAIYKDDTTTPLLPLFGGSWEPICASAASVTHTVFASLAACDLPVQSLDLFNSRHVLRCSLPCSVLNNIDFTSGRLVSSLGHLTEISLRISDPVVDQSSNETPLEATHQPNLDGLRSFLRTCSSIRTLDLAHFSLAHVNNANLQHGRILRVLSESGLPYLQNLTLQGFKVTEDELLSLLGGFEALRSISLRSIKLMDGSFKRILDYCTMDAAMEELALDSLFESSIVLFEPPWVVRPSASEDPRVGYPDSRAIYRRTSDDSAGLQIKHHAYQGHTLDSPFIKAWRQDLRNRFGPLPKDGKPSCLQPYIPAEQTWRYR